MLETLLGMSLATLFVTGLVEGAKAIGTTAAGATAMKALGSLHGATMARLGGHLGLPENQDTARAIRRAQIQSLQNLLKDWRRYQEETGWAEEDGLPRTMFAGRAHDFLNRQIGLCPRLTLQMNEQVVQQIEKTLDGALGGHPTDALTINADALKSAAQRVVLDELRAGIRDGETDSIVIADSFIVAFEGRHSTTDGWFNRFVLLIDDAIKRDDKFRRMFDASRLAVTADLSLDSNIVVHGLAAEAEKIQAKLDRLEGGMRDGFAAVQTQIAELRNQVLAAVEARGDFARAEAAGLERSVVIKLATRLKPNELLDFDQAVAVLEDLIDTALRSIARGERTGNQDKFVEHVLAQVARYARAGENDRASKEIDAALSELDRREQEHREALQRSRIALLHSGIEQDRLRRDAAGLAQRVQRIIDLEHSDAAARFAALRARQDEFYVRGRDQGINFDLEISIDIARLALAAARDADQRGSAGNDLGTALSTLGARESGTAPAGSRRRLSRRIARKDARARAAQLGHEHRQPGRRTHASRRPHTRFATRSACGPANRDGV